MMYHLTVSSIVLFSFISQTPKEDQTTRFKKDLSATQSLTVSITEAASTPATLPAPTGTAWHAAGKAWEVSYAVSSSASPTPTVLKVHHVGLDISRFHFLDAKLEGGRLVVLQKIGGMTMIVGGRVDNIPDTEPRILAQVCTDSDVNGPVVVGGLIREYNSTSIRLELEDVNGRKFEKTVQIAAAKPSRAD